MKKIRIGIPVSVIFLRVTTNKYVNHFIVRLCDIVHIQFNSLLRSFI